MGQIHRMLVTALLGLGVFAPGLASAHDGRWDHDGDRHEDHDRWRETATLTVRNDFDGEARVFVDQRYVGVVGGDRSASFQVPAGTRSVLVSRPGTNYALAQTRLQMPCGTTVTLPVQAPTGMLRVENTGEAALRVQVGGKEAWLYPGASTQIPVRTGNETLVASIRGPRSEWKAIEKTVWVEPGQVACQTLHPDPTVVIVTNHDQFPVRAVLDGEDEGFVAPGASKRVWVRPGNTNVVLMDPHGRVRFNTTVVVGKGNEGRVVFDPRYSAVGGVVTTSHDGRPPSGPPHGDGCSFH